MSTPSFRSGVRTAIVLAALLAVLCACTTARPSRAVLRTISDGETFSLSTGDRVSLAGQGVLTYLGLRSDSRCPVDMQCVWAGSAEIRLQWQPESAASETFSLHSNAGDRGHRLGPGLLSLVSLARGTSPDAQLKFEHLP